MLTFRHFQGTINHPPVLHFTALSAKSTSKNRVLVVSWPPTTPMVFYLLAILQPVSPRLEMTLARRVFSNENTLTTSSSNPLSSLSLATSSSMKLVVRARGQLLLQGLGVRRTWASITSCLHCSCDISAPGQSRR